MGNYQQYQLSKWYYKTTFLIVVTFLLWPVGLSLLIARIVALKLGWESHGKISAFVGYIFVGLWALLLIYDIVNGKLRMTFLIDSASLLLPALIATLVSLRAKNQIKRYKRYVDMIVNEKISSIDFIAATLSKSKDDVCKDLKHMIDMGILNNFHINLESYKILFPGQTM